MVCREKRLLSQKYIQSVQCNATSPLGLIPFLYVMITRMDNKIEQLLNFDNGKNLALIMVSREFLWGTHDDMCDCWWKMHDARWLSMKEWLHTSICAWSCEISYLKIYRKCSVNKVTWGRICTSMTSWPSLAVCATEGARLLSGLWAADTTTWWSITNSFPCPLSGVSSSGSSLREFRPDRLSTKKSHKFVTSILLTHFKQKLGNTRKWKEMQQ